MLKDNILNNPNDYQKLMLKSANINDRKIFLTSLNPQKNDSYDKTKINSSNFDIIKQLNRETFDISKIIEEKNKLYKSCSVQTMKPKNKKFIQFTRKGCC